MITLSITAQYKVSGVIVSENNRPLNNVEVYDAQGGLLAETSTKGFYEFITSKKELQAPAYSRGL